jgi:hypothetical protein
VPAKEVVYQRYADADLATVGEEVVLEKVYGPASNRRTWLIAAAVVGGLLVLGALTWMLFRRKRAPSGSDLSEAVTPFVAAALLREIRDRPEFAAAHRPAIDGDIAVLERYYFSAERNGDAEPDLHGLVARWSVDTPAGR